MNIIHAVKTLPRRVDDALAARLRVMPRSRRTRWRGRLASLARAGLLLHTGRRSNRAKQKPIKLLEEQKQAIIPRAVTRGLAHTRNLSQHSRHGYPNV